MKKIILSILSIIVVLTLTSCKPKTLEKCKKKFERRGYVVGYTETILSSDGLIGTVAAGTNSIPTLESANDDHIFIGSLYETIEKAKKALEEIENEYGKTDYVLIDNWLIISDKKSLKIFK